MASPDTPCDFAKSRYIVIARLRNFWGMMWFILGACVAAFLCFSIIFFLRSSWLPGALSVLGTIVTGASTTWITKQRRVAADEEEKAFADVVLHCAKHVTGDVKPEAINETLRQADERQNLVVALRQEDWFKELETAKQSDKKGRFLLSAATALLALVAAIATAWAAYRAQHSNQERIATLEAQRARVSDPEGTYIWDVTITRSGDRWKGSIAVDKNGVADMRMIRVEKCSANPNMELPLLKQEPGALVTAPQPGKLHIHIPVQFYIYDKECQWPTENQPLEPTTILDGDLYQTTGYIGQINYTSPTEQGRGGMNLVKEIHGPGSD
jgi:hypothetical protein